MAVPYVPPALREGAFNCPSCRAYARQSWYSLSASISSEYVQNLAGYHVSRCYHCQDWAVWDGNVLVIPVASTAPPAHGQMPTGVARVYAEAARIADLSPRAAAALLRLAIEQLVRELGGKGSLSQAIGDLVETGLPVRVQQALDVVRVIGNQAVHPGDLSEEPQDGVVQSLFALVNVIVDVMIAQPAEIEALYDALPDGARAHITERDRDLEMLDPQ